MEYVVAALVLLGTVAYAVVLAVNIEKGKSWALEIARTISMLDPDSASHVLRVRAAERDAVRPPDSPDEVEQPLDKLAA